MPQKQLSNVDAWLERETDHVRKALETASRHFDVNDNLTVNTLEAVYGQESSFGTMMGERGSSKAAGHFQFKPATAERYSLSVSKNNDQRFNIDFVSSAAARYLKDLNTIFGKKTVLSSEKNTIAVKDISERSKFAIGAFNAGEGRIAGAQRLAKESGDNPQLWADVEKFLEAAGASKDQTHETRQFVDKVLAYQAEFAEKSPADKDLKLKKPIKRTNWCTEGHWVTIDDRPVFICD
jgi:membrane-bound lytic murein transglycosylase MltF